MFKAFALALFVVLAAYFVHSPIFISKTANPPQAIPATDTLINMTASTLSRSVVKKVLSQETAEGAGAFVRRSIGSMSLRNLSPFLLLDHFNIEPGAGFPDHPHRGQATVTYMTEGAFQHEDSAGHKGKIEAGGVQWMCAGRGIIHAEMPVHGPGLPNPKGLQLWVDLPKEHKMTAPTYQELDAAQIPTAYPEGPDGGTSIRVISGQSYGVESPVRPLGGCWYFHVIMKKNGSNIFQQIPTGWTTFIYVFKGAVSVGTDSTSHDVYNTLILSNNGTEGGVSVTSTKDNTEFMLAAGEPLEQNVVQYGPFVMTSREDIQKTIMDYQMGKNGFEKAHVWKSIIGN